MLTVKNARLCDSGSAVAVECLRSGAEEASGGKSTAVTLYLLPEDYAPLHLQKGPQSPDTEDLLLRGDEKCRALRAARRTVGYSSKSGAELTRRLRSKGFSADAARAAAGILTGDGEIDEAADALRFAELSVKKGRGRLRILQELRARGYTGDALCRASAYLDTVDFAGVCAEVIRKKYGAFPAGPEERKKAAAALLRLGFSSSEIKEAIKRL